MDSLKQKILNEGEVYEGNILKVDGFLNHRIDIPFMREIAKEFHITREKAKHIYDWHYHKQAVALVNALTAQVESPQERMDIWDHYFRNNFTPKRRYEILIKK